MGDMLVGLHELLRQFNQRNELPAFLIGVIVALLLGLAAWKVLSRWQQSRLSSEIRWLKERIEELRRNNEELDGRVATACRERDLLQDLNIELSGQREGLRTRIVELSDDCERQKADWFDLGVRCKRERKRRREIERRAKELDDQLKALLSAEVKIWDRPVVGQIPPFLPLSLRKTPILSLINLKGGVGKTTITANLGVALALKGLRVLMIDLDYQGSLSSLCLSFQESEDVLHGGRFIDDVLRDDASDRAQALGLHSTRLQDVPECEIYLVAAGESFERVETQLMMSWHVGASGDDVRYRLRKALHSVETADRFDIVLLDCPPRLTTGCVNALTSSDYALIPVLLDGTSAEAAPRLLRWLKLLRPTICPDLAVMGIIGNRSTRTKLIQRHQIVWSSLKDKCREAWGEPIRHFDEAIVREHASLPNRFAALCPAHRGRYLDLADVILKELPAYARHRSAAIPSIPDSGARGVRG